MKNKNIQNLTVYVAALTAGMILGTTSPKYQTVQLNTKEIVEDTITAELIDNLEMYNSNDLDQLDTITQKMEESNQENKKEFKKQQDIIWRFYH